MTAIYTKDCLMELNSEIVTTPPRDASTVVLLRDSAQGLQVLMMQRHSASQVLGGVHVFPGGKLDDDDMSPLVLKWLKEDSAQLHHLLQEPVLDQQRAAGLYVAALRELHEEAGILLGSAVASAPPSEPWHQVVSSLGHQLQATLLTPWSRWITPKQPSVTNKRFDTRFFLAHAEPQQEGRHDNHEATEIRWLSPDEALRAYWDRQIELAPPQIMSLAHLRQYTQAEQALADARQRPPALVEPEAHDIHGERMICYPGDPMHSVRTAAFSGPTRLYFRNKRFEPEGGLAALMM